MLTIEQNVTKPTVSKKFALKRWCVWHFIVYAITVVSCQGWRVDMEDAHVSRVGLGLGAAQNWAFFGVFDGHAGARVSLHCSQHLLDAVLETEEVKEAIKEASSSKVE